MKCKIQKKNDTYLAKNVLFTFNIPKNIFAIPHCRHFCQIFQKLENHATFNMFFLTEEQYNICRKENSSMKDEKAIKYEEYHDRSLKIEDGIIIFAIRQPVLKILMLS